jgi:hypothetical protein
MNVSLGLVIGACFLFSMVMGGVSIVDLLRPVRATTMPTASRVRARSA